METHRTRKGLGPALFVALFLHGVLLLVLLWQAAFAPPAPVPVSDRMTVSLATDVGLEDTAPVPVPESRLSTGPVVSDEASPVAPPEPPSEVLPRPIPTQQPRSVPAPAPAVRSEPRPRQTERARETPRPAPARERGGSQDFANAFRDGAGSSSDTEETRPPAASFGAAEQAALSSAITRQLRPKWTAPNGVDVDKLVSVVAWRLNKDGSLRGTPRLVRQSGITPSNEAQAKLHAERAIRAVQLAAPFNLPEQFYDRWDDLEWTFDRRL